MEKWKTTYSRFRGIMEHIGWREIAMASASTAFWLFFSLVPMAVLCVSVLPFTPFTEAQLLSIIAPFVPESFYAFLQTILSDIYSRGVMILPLSAVVTLWTSAAGFSWLIRGLELVYDRPRPAGFFHRRARGILFTVVMLGSILLAVLLMSFGRSALLLIERHFPGTSGFFTLLLRLRTVFGTAILTLVFIAVYRRGSGMRLPLRTTLPGALFAAVSWSIFTWLFSLWIRFSGGYSTYGRLASVAVVMLWMYCSLYILMLGACFNRALPEIREQRKNR